ncbi:MAG: hypothetical protein HY761_05080 [Candidatus Omnitrophica bacterium]|nr:hypothetical protein [Candidatus Omnitrophota bacterium]
MKIRLNLLFIIVVIFVCLISLGGVFGEDALVGKDVLITVVYPQKPNAPKRQEKKVDSIIAVNGRVNIGVTGISADQLKSPDLYLEYFLDDNLVYATKKNSKGNNTERELGFIFDTVLYSEGEHNLMVNLWDKFGSSAIGMRKIIIQNKDS